MKLKKVCKIIGGNPAPKEGFSSSAEALPFVKMKDLGRAHLTNNLTDIETKIDPIFAKKKRLKIIKKGSVLLPRSGSVALNHRAILGQDSYMVSHICALEVINPNLNNIYLYYFLRAKRLDNITKKTTGLDAITFEDLGNIDIHFPEVYKQKLIVQILDTADTLRQKRREQLNLLDDYLKSVFLEMFGDPQVNPKNFPMQELKEFYCDDRNGTKCGPFGSALKKHEYTVEGIPVWNMDNISLQGRMISNVNLFISKEKYDQLKAYSVQNGDVIISRAGTVGKMCVLQSPFEKSIISSNLIRVRLKTEFLPQFFVALMTYCKGRVGRLKTGDDDSFTHMNTGILDKLKFPYPPIELQNKFASIVEQVEHTKQKMHASLDEMDNHFNSLMQRYFG